MKALGNMACAFQECNVANHKEQKALKLKLAIPWKAMNFATMSWLKK
jgi:hypothetical protein